MALARVLPGQRQEKGINFLQGQGLSNKKSPSSSSETDDGVSGLEGTTSVNQDYLKNHKYLTNIIAKIDKQIVALGMSSEGGMEGLMKSEKGQTILDARYKAKEQLAGLNAIKQDAKSQQESLAKLQIEINKSGDGGNIATNVSANGTVTLASVTPYKATAVDGTEFTKIMISSKSDMVTKAMQNTRISHNGNDYILEGGGYDQVTGNDGAFQGAIENGYKIARESMTAYGNNRSGYVTSVLNGKGDNVSELTPEDATGFLMVHRGSHNEKAVSTAAGVIYDNLSNAELHDMGNGFFNDVQSNIFRYVDVIPGDKKKGTKPTYNKKQKIAMEKVMSGAKMTTEDLHHLKAVQKRERERSLQSSVSQLSVNSIQSSVSSTQYSVDKLQALT